MIMITTRRIVTLVGFCLPATAIGLGYLATRPAAGLMPRLSTLIARTIEADGNDAAVARYRDFRGRGFPELRESEADTNSLGYTLLSNGNGVGAIQVFRLNAETHPKSANAYDSLGEAYLAAGDQPNAIAAYERAIALDPKMKTAVYELRQLTGRPRPPFPLIVLFHIGAGVLGLLAGAIAIALRKGSRQHALAGRVFVASMLAMTTSAVHRAALSPDGDRLNVLMGGLTFYLVVTAWLTVRHRSGGAGLVDLLALLTAVAVGVGLVAQGLAGTRFSGAALAFGVVALLAAASDARMLARGGVFGGERIARHLWRMGAALFIAVGSLFLGQAQIFPREIRGSGLLGVPSLLVLIALLYWLIRVGFTGEFQRAAPTTRREHERLDHLRLRLSHVLAAEPR